METHSLLPPSIASPLEIAYADTTFSHALASSALNELSAYIHELGDPCLSSPLPSLDFSVSSGASLCRKRRALSDLTQQFSQLDGWKLNDELGLPQIINGDPPQTLCHNDQATNPSLFTASHKCSDLEDVLNFLWMEDATASPTQSASASASASSPFACSDRVSLIGDLDLEYGANDSSSNQAESNDKPSRDNLQTLEANQEGLIRPRSDKEKEPLAFNWESLQKKEAHERQSWGSLQHKKFEVIRGSWQGGTRASWQQKKQGEIRASWLDEIKASWQPKQEGGRASWQTEGEIRASWQLEKKEGQNRASWQAEGVGKSSKEERGEGEVSASEKQSVEASSGGVALKRSKSGGAWAGPTLFDIESALALNEQGSPHPASPLSSFSPLASPTPALSTPHHSHAPFFDVKKFLSDDPIKSSGEQDTLDSSWRLKLQKRNSLEPKFSLKVETEEKALGDGYRWRKYGQKAIKNSPFPRSYYRCSTGKCNAKKQVEKSQEDESMFLVTYEGIHLHHRPNPLHKFRTLCDLHDDEKEKSSGTLYSPSSSTSCSYSTSPICSASSSHTLLT